MMKKLVVFVLCFVFVCTLAGCQQSPPPQNMSSSLQTSSSSVSNDGSVSNASSNSDASFDGTIFKYADKSYNVSEREPSVNSIEECIPVGEYVIINGHINPKISYYGIFNTETLEFEKDIIGVNLIWHDDDINTIVYSAGPDLFRYDESLIATCELKNSEYINDISFIENNTKIEVTVESENGEIKKQFDLNT